MMRNVPTKYARQYKYVNLEGSEFSNSNCSSERKHSSYFSQNRLGSNPEDVRGVKAMEFREMLKRSNSNSKPVIAESELVWTASKPPAINRALSGCSFSVKHLRKTSPKIPDKILNKFGSKRPGLNSERFSQTIRFAETSKASNSLAISPKVSKQIAVPSSHTAKYTAGTLSVSNSIDLVSFSQINSEQVKKRRGRKERDQHKVNAFTYTTFHL
mmetsp:Transcript_15224/g.17646  ORF Transcript_15224/g.17646 Transcript_15224/m.17646 type:complete len:214 (-) Transcript_15224:49-690(-)